MTLALVIGQLMPKVGKDLYSCRERASDMDCLIVLH